MIEILSIDLSNYCTKGCPFCYNHSTRKGNVMWKPQEVISFAKDCVAHGVKAVSLGGGEPFEYDGILDIIDALAPLCYLSITTNGMPLVQPNGIPWKTLKEHMPDKIHVTLHNPDSQRELNRVIMEIRTLEKVIGVRAGCNLLVSASKIDACRQAYATLRRFMEPNQIIIVPMRYGDTPSTVQFARVSRPEPFQSTSCLFGCKKPEDFVSVSWDKKVNYCSFAGGKEPLLSLDYQGMIDALERVKWQPCEEIKRQ